jgi:SAM-dependent methyltransferase
MQKFPEVTESFGELYALLTAPKKLQLLLASIELKVFNCLSEPASAETVAAAIGGHLDNTGLFLNGLVAMGLVKKKNGLYENMPASQTFLVEGESTYLGQLFVDQAAPPSQTFDELVTLVKNGPPQQVDTYISSDEMTDEEVLSYVNFERSGLAQMIARIASELPEFPSFQKMLDLGCGPGLNGLAVVAAHPSMKGVSFDRPRTSEFARRSSKEYEMEDRMTVLSGDYAQDSIGNGYDLILTSDTLYYSRDKLASIMAKIHAALNPGGVFLSFHVGFTHGRTQPGNLVVGTLLNSLKGNDMGLFDQGYLVDAMIQAGFKSVRSRTLQADWTPLDLDIARK